MPCNETQKSNHSTNLGSTYALINVKMASLSAGEVHPFCRIVTSIDVTHIIIRTYMCPRDVFLFYTMMYFTASLSDDRAVGNLHTSCFNSPPQEQCISVQVLQYIRKLLSMRAQIFPIYWWLNGELPEFLFAKDQFCPRPLVKPLLA